MKVKTAFFTYGIPAIKAILILIAGVLFVSFLSRAVEKVLIKHQNQYIGMILSKLIYYLGLFLVVMTALDNFGISTTQLIGAAGVVGVAVGFAAQTSVSNIISGAFLIAEKPFVIGDRLQIGNISGNIQAIDLLSVKLITSDNEYVRIPNEYLVKNSFINLTKFDLRRISVVVGVSYKEDLNKVLHLLNEVINENEYNKNKEKTLSVITDFADSCVNLTAYMWVPSNKILLSKSSLLNGIKQKFDQEKVEIPFPQIVVRQES